MMFHVPHYNNLYWWNGNNSESEILARPVDMQIAVKNVHKRRWGCQQLQQSTQRHFTVFLLTWSCLFDLVKLLAPHLRIMNWPKQRGGVTMHSWPLLLPSFGLLFLSFGPGGLRAPFIAWPLLLPSFSLSFFFSSPSFAFDPLWPNLVLNTLAQGFDFD